VIDGLIADGFVPYLFAEGSYGSRLEVIRDVPAGRTVWQFDRTDMRGPRRSWGGRRLCPGNVPSSLLSLAAPEDVTAYCRDLIEAVDRGAASSSMSAAS